MLRNRNFLIIALIAVVNALGYGIIVPILYSYNQTFGLSDFQSGLLFALFSICSFLSTPLIGRLSDKYGRKPLLVFSLIGTALSFLMMAFAPNALILFLARALDGVTAGNIPVASAVISDTIEPKDRAKGFGVIGASFGFGFALGPAISAFTLQWGLQVPFLIAASVTIFSVILTAVFLPETNKHMGQVDEKKLFDFRKLFSSLFDANVGKTLLIQLLVSFAFGMFILAYQPFSVKTLGLNPTQISLNFTVFGLVGLISQLVIIPLMLKRVRELKLFVTAIVAMALAFGGMFFATELIFFTLMSILLSLANAFVGPLIQTLLSKEVDAKSQGTIQGINSSYMSLGTIFGPIAGGALATLSLPTPFLGGAIILGLCAVVATKIYLNHARKVSEF